MQITDLYPARSQAHIPLVLTKLRAPRLPDVLVERPRLTARLSCAPRLMLIAAPAGYGKTTLAAQWIAGQDLGSAACVSLHPADNECNLFERYVIAALATACDLLLDDASCTLTAVINALAHGERRVALILDDVHVLTSSAAQHALQRLLDHLPECVSLVLTSRAQPTLALGRLRAAGSLIELCADDLRFTLDEASALLNDVMRLGLSDCEVAEMAERTEGWVAGLRLAAAALMQQSPDRRAQTITEFGGGHRFVREYLREEVFIRQDEATQQFLVRTARLDPLSPQACDAVAGCTGSEDMLERLTRANVFVQWLDDSRSRYRYHRLFAEFLTQFSCEAHVGARSLQHDSNASRFHEPLSEREQEVAALMAQGLSNPQIAQRICVAPGTVKRHVHNIFGKLHARTRAEAITRARHYTAQRQNQPLNVPAGT